jgi:hypothetical protein
VSSLDELVSVERGVGVGEGEGGGEYLKLLSFVFGLYNVVRVLSLAHHSPLHEMFLLLFDGVLRTEFRCVADHQFALHMVHGALQLLSAPCSALSSICSP